MALSLASSSQEPSRSSRKLNDCTSKYTRLTWRKILSVKRRHAKDSCTTDCELTDQGSRELSHRSKGERKQCSPVDQHHDLVECEPPLVHFGVHKLTAFLTHWRASRCGAGAEIWKVPSWAWPKPCILLYCPGRTKGFMIRSPVELPFPSVR